MNDAERRAADILARACNLYCDWYDHGKPKFMNAEGCAYELVSACRQALAVLKSDPKTVIMSTFLMKGADIDDAE